MKYLIITMLVLFDMLFALPNDKMTDIEPSIEYTKEIQSIQTSDYECNLYVEKTGASLYLMSIAEQNNDKKTISSEFLTFLKNSDNAIEYCKYVSNNISEDIINIQEGVTIYYNSSIK